MKEALEEPTGPAPATQLPTALWISIRILLASAFLVSGAMKLLDFPGAVSEVRALTGMEPAGFVAAMVILTQLGGSALLLLGERVAALGAGLLAGFTLVATIVGHAFWEKTGVPQTRDLMTFLEHLGLIGGLLLAALVSRRVHGSRS